MLRMQNVSKIYRTDTVETHALRQFSLHVREGEFVSVTGPSGSGKTTFLNIAGLLEEATGGSYELDGRDVAGLKDAERSRLRNEKIGYKVREHSLQKVPIIAAAGAREAENRSLALRRLGDKGQETLALDDAIAKISGEGSRPGA